MIGYIEVSFKTGLTVFYRCEVLIKKADLTLLKSLALFSVFSVFVFRTVCD